VKLLLDPISGDVVSTHGPTDKVLTNGQRCGQAQCVWECVRERERKRERVCVCACVFERESVCVRVCHPSPSPKVDTLGLLWGGYNQ